MKPLASFLFIFLFAFSACAQTDKDRSEWVASILGESKEATAEAKNRIAKSNFGPLWTRLHDNDRVLGFIGDNYQRLRIVILSATKHPSQPDTYNVTGKTMVKDVIRGFTGTMKITKASSTRGSELEEDYKSEKIKEAGSVVGEYHFLEDAKLTNTGRFDGVFATDWYVDRNRRLQYDEVMAGADGYRNNQFAGTWTSYRTKASKPAHWGDSRIPVSGGLDVGDGEFWVDSQYLPNGWQSHRDAYSKQDKRALMEERSKWWR
jgi:hypothetical protein